MEFKNTLSYLRERLRRADDLDMLRLSGEGSQRRAEGRASCGEVQASCRRSKEAPGTLRTRFYFSEQKVDFLGGLWEI